MTAILQALVSAGLPLVGQLVALGQLFFEAQTKALTLPEVQTEIAKILKRSTEMDAALDAEAGIKPPNS